MARDAKSDYATGNLETMIKCPGCGWQGMVYYNTQPPLYCSTACKQKAYRKRKMRNSTGVTLFFREWEEQGLGSLSGQLEFILNQWGEEAARASAKLCLQAVEEIRQKYQRY